MRDLNDLFYFSEVVSHGGFAAAGRALGQPKSKLSRHVAALETRLGVRLIERSSRRFRVTDLGEAFYQRCLEAMTGLERAETDISNLRSMPSGLVRFSAPNGYVDWLSPMLVTYAARYPHVRLQVIATNNPVDLIRDRIDIALRVRTELTSDQSLIVRKLGVLQQILVANSTLADRIVGKGIEALDELPKIASVEEAGPVTWNLSGPQGETHEVRHEPQLSCNDYVILREGIAAGLGVALLPEFLCEPDLRAGRFIRVFPDWHRTVGTVHVVFTSKRGQPPATRALINHLTTHFRRQERRSGG